MSASGGVSLTALHLETLKCSLGSHWGVCRKFALHLLYRILIEKLCLLLHHLVAGRVERCFGPCESIPQERSTTYGFKCFATFWMSKSNFTLPNLFLSLPYNVFMCRIVQSAVIEGNFYDSVWHMNAQWMPNEFLRNPLIEYLSWNHNMCSYRMAGNFAGGLFWQIGGFESNPPIFHPAPNTALQYRCDVLIIAKS